MRLDFNRILADNQSLVFSLALRFLRDRAGAEELSQDVFLQLYQRLAAMESPAHATSWLRRAICHRCIDEARKRRYRPRVSLEAVPEPSTEPASPDPFLNDRIRRLVGELPDNARMVVLLRYQEDLDPTEIADLLQMSISTVKSHLHRSLAILRGRMQRSAQAEGSVVRGVKKQEICR